METCRAKSLGINQFWVVIQGLCLWCFWGLFCIALSEAITVKWSLRLPLNLSQWNPSLVKDKVLTGASRANGLGALKIHTRKKSLKFTLKHVHPFFESVIVFSQGPPDSSSAPCCVHLQKGIAIPNINPEGILQVKKSSKKSAWIPLCRSLRSSTVVWRLLESKLCTPLSEWYIVGLRKCLLKECMDISMKECVANLIRSCDVRNTCICNYRYSPVSGL